MNRSALLALHATEGARISAADPPQLLTYGDVPAEYAAAQEAAVVFDETDRGRVEVSGPDAPAFLHRLLANDVRNVAVGHGNRNLLLSSKGKVLFDFDLFRLEDRLVLSLPPGRSTAMIAALDMYLFSEKVVLSDTSEEYAPLTLCGPKSAESIERVLGANVPTDEYTWSIGTLEDERVIVVRVSIAGSLGFRLVCAPAVAPKLWQCLREASVRPAGVVVRDILRVEAGAALYGVDIDDAVYPQEARLEGAFSLDKGCYIGQEVVAKIDTYGGLNKQLVALRVSHDDPVPHGTRLFRNEDGEWRDLGVVTSWAYSFVLDTGLVLAYVKRRHQKVGTEFRVGESDATAKIVPIPVRANAVPVTGGFE